MPKFHVHVYRTIQLFEIDIQAKDKIQALERGLEEAKKPDSLWRLVAKGE